MMPAPHRDSVVAFLKSFARSGREGELGESADDLLFIFDLPHQSGEQRRSEVAKLRRTAKLLDKAAETLPVQEWHQYKAEKKMILSLARRLRDYATKPDGAPKDYNKHELATWSITTYGRLTGEAASRRNEDAQQICAKAWEWFGIEPDSAHDTENYLGEAIKRARAGIGLTKQV